MDLSFVIFVQKMYCPFTEGLFKLITLIGEEGFFLIAFLLAFYLINKRFAFNMATIYFSGMALNGLFKIAARRLRPYQVSNEVLNLKQENSFSFPSGHTQAITMVSLSYTLEAKRKHKFFILSLVVGILTTLLVALSRIFLGQHYFTDVLVGAALGILMAYFGGLALSYIKKVDLICIIVSAVSFLAIFIFTSHMLDVGGKFTQFFKISALISAGYLGYFLENRFVNFEIEKVKPIFKLCIAFIGLLVAISLYFVIIYFVKINILAFISYYGLTLILLVLLPYLFKILFYKRSRS